MLGRCEALKATVTLSRTEGILPALESAHAVAEAIEDGSEDGEDGCDDGESVGRGDKDMGILAREMDLKGSESARLRESAGNGERLMQIDGD